MLVTAWLLVKMCRVDSHHQSYKIEINNVKFLLEIFDGLLTTI